MTLYDSTGKVLLSSMMQIFPKYTVIGDSLACGYLHVDGTLINSMTAVTTKNNWPGYLELRTGRTFTNIAVGGSSAATWRTDHIETANIETDCYLVGLGVNDKRYANAVGTSEDIATNPSDNSNTFYGNFDFIIRTIKTYNPNAHIFVFTIPVSENANDYNDAIRHIASLYEKVHCIDLHNLYPEDFSSGFIADNFSMGHYNTMAYCYISELIEKAICQHIYANSEKFLTVPYA